MITPNKFTSFDESAISKLEIILREKDINVISLYEKTKNKFTSIDQFIYTLDVLYILGKIEVSESTGAISYAD